MASIFERVEHHVDRAINNQAHDLSLVVTPVSDDDLEFILELHKIPTFPTDIDVPCPSQLACTGTLQKLNANSPLYTGWCIQGVMDINHRMCIPTYKCSGCAIMTRNHCNHKA